MPRFTPSLSAQLSLALTSSVLFGAAPRFAIAQGIPVAQSATALATTPSEAVVGAPRLTFGSRLLQGTLGKAYEGALDNLLRVNTIPDTKGEHNKAGLMTPSGLFVRAGGGYSEPWTRDASLNSWNAASLLEPTVARNTLWAVCQQQPDGSIVLQRDNQWWDKVIWITSAWNHYKVTGDAQFLKAAYGVAQDDLTLMRREHFNAAYGLFQGPSVFNDGIAGYPEPEYDPQNNSSFVLDHPYTKDLMALSTNCAYYSAYRCAALMAQQLGRPESEARGFNRAADALKTAINARLWIPSKATYGYFIHGAGPLVGRRDDTQEGLGLSFAILFGVADAQQAQGILRTVQRKPYGLPSLWPHFPRYSDAQPGRHNVIVWPLVNGMWASAAAQAGDVNMFRDETENLALLALGTGNHFYEIYNSVTGKPDGGWQSGHSWDSQPDQTWSATAYLRMIYSGLFGMEFQTKGLSFAPKLPSQWGKVALSGVRYRGMTLDINLEGQGNRIARALVDGKPSANAFIPATWTGRHTLTLALKDK